MAARRRLSGGLVSTVGMLAVVLGAVWLLRGFIAPNGEGQDGAREIDAAVPAPTESADPRPMQLDSAAVPVEVSSSAPAAEGGSDDGPESRPDVAYWGNSNTLRAELEGTLYEQIDPGVYLDLALSLSKLDVDNAAIPEPHAGGAVRYKLQGAPTGMTAELWLSHADGSAFQNPVMSFKVALEATAEPYVLEGAVRRAAEVQVTIWTNPDGQVTNFAILTDIRPSGETAKLGLPITHGRIPTGLHYVYDAVNPDQSVASLGVVEHGRPTDYRVTPTLTGGPWPRSEDLQALHAAMSKQHKSLSNH